MNATKIFTIAVLAVIGLFAAALSVTAQPYDGVNRIGTYYQQQSTTYFAGGYGFDYQYNYYAPPRAGGWFGQGVEWTTGLRSPVYSPVPPVRYSNFYTPVCGYPCWFGGGYGYPRARASDFRFRYRIGGY